MNNHLGYFWHNLCQVILSKKYRSICVWFAKPLLDDTWLLYVQRRQFYGSWTSVKLQQDCLANLGQLTSFVKAYLIIFLSCIENNFHFIWFVIIENRMMWRRGRYHLLLLTSSTFFFDNFLGYPFFRQPVIAFL